jgi:serine/threonine-protein kinase
MGTVAYLAPEQVERGVADPRSDVYAAGILFFELLTGRKPYEGETAIQVAYRHVHDDVPAPSSFVPTVPAELDALVARATSRDPDGRPADARRFLAEVVQVRRALSDAELDAGGSGSGPAGGPSGPADHTLVVPLPQARTRRAARRRSADTGPTRVPTRRSRRGPVALLLVLLLATALSGAAWYLAAGPGAYTSAPRLVGLSQQQAAARAEAGGFSLRVAGREYDEQVPVGHVLSTDPGPTERIRKDGTIRVVLSRGPERYAVPDLRGKSRAEAERALAASHLSVGDVTSAYDDDVDRGDVVSTSPAPGELRKRDTAVALVLSKGVEPVPVPAVVGRPLDEAKAELAAAGLGAAVTEKYDDGVALGVVISQQPAKGTAPKGSEVRLVVSKGPPPVPVPNVTDLKLGEATRILERAGFRVRVQGTRFINRVFDQSPKGNTEAPRGSTVTLRTI